MMILRGGVKRVPDPDRETDLLKVEGLQPALPVELWQQGTGLDCNTGYMSKPVSHAADGEELRKDA